jgi:hypothetical protein
VELLGRIRDAWTSARVGAADLTAQRWLALAALISRNVVPIIGIVFLDWRAENLIVLYFADFILDIGMCVALLFLLDPEAKTVMQFPDTVGGRMKRALAILMVIGIIAAVFAFVFGMPVFGMFVMDSDLSLGGLFADARFRDGFLMHLILSSWTFLGVYRYFSRMRDSDPSFDVSVPVRGRFRFVLSRWLAIYVTGLSIPFFPTLMVVAYCAATVYFELFPQRVVKGLDAPRDDSLRLP